MQPVMASPLPVKTIGQSGGSSSSGKKTRRRKLEDRGQSALQQREETLRDKLAARLVNSCFDTTARKFLPARTAEEFIRPDNQDPIFRELKLDHTNDDHQDFVNYIVNEASKLFAIVLDVFEDTAVYFAMQGFYENDIDDACLPIFPDKATVQADNDQHHRSVVFQELNGRFWSAARIDKFYEAQWKVWVPCFSTSEASQDLNSRAILPFIMRGSESRRGGFGEVDKVKIHERHVQDPEGLVSCICLCVGVCFAGEVVILIHSSSIQCPNSMQSR